MAQNNNILQELNELNSSLTAGLRGNIYSLPEGYFDGLADQLLNRIKTLNAGSVAEELEILSPMLNKLSRKMPYSVPEKYFEGLDHSVSVKEELDTISPFLGGLKKEMPFEVPAGYFEDLSTPVKEPQKAKVISFTSRKWIRVAAAAVITGIIAMTSVMVIGKKDLEGMPIQKFVKRLDKEIKKTSDKDLNEFIQYSDANLNGNENASVNVGDDTNNFLKTVPDAELKEFLEETSSDDAESSMMN